MNKENDSDYGLSSGDEADLEVLAVGIASPPLKRKAAPFEGPSTSTKRQQLPSYQDRDALERAYSELQQQHRELEARLKALNGQLTAQNQPPSASHQSAVSSIKHEEAPSSLYPVTSAVALRTLNTHFRLQRFRLKQEAAISRLLAGGSAVVVFPTGAVLLV